MADVLEYSIFIVVNTHMCIIKSADGGRYTRFRHGTHEVRTQGHSNGDELREASRRQSSPGRSRVYTSGTTSAGGLRYLRSCRFWVWRGMQVRLGRRADAEVPRPVTVTDCPGPGCTVDVVFGQFSSVQFSTASPGSPVPTLRRVQRGLNGLSPGGARNVHV